MPTNVLHGKVLRKIKKLPQELQGVAFYTILPPPPPPPHADFALDLKILSTASYNHNK